MRFNFTSIASHNLMNDSVSIGEVHFATPICAPDGNDCWYGSPYYIVPRESEICSPGIRLQVIL
jgi:hypothetical protein